MCKGRASKDGRGENSHLAKAEKRQAGAPSSGFSWPCGEFGFFLCGLASCAAGVGGGGREGLSRSTLPWGKVEGNLAGDPNIGAHASLLLSHPACKKSLYRDGSSR